MQSHLETEIARLALTAPAVERALLDWARCWLAEVPGTRLGDGGLSARVWQDRFVQHYAMNLLRETADHEGPDRLVQAFRTAGVHWLEARLTPSDNVRGKLHGLVASAQQRRSSMVSRLMDRAHGRDANRRDGSAQHTLLRLNKDRDIPGVGLVFHFVKRHRQPCSTKPGYGDVKIRLWQLSSAHFATRARRTAFKKSTVPWVSSACEQLHPIVDSRSAR